MVKIFQLVIRSRIMNNFLHDQVKKKKSIFQVLQKFYQYSLRVYIENIIGRKTNMVPFLFLKKAPSAWISGPDVTKRFQEFWETIHIVLFTKRQSNDIELRNGGRSTGFGP